MRDLSLIFILLYIVAIIGVCVFLLVLVTRFVNAHRRCANALELIAQKLPKAADE